MGEVNPWILLEMDDLPKEKNDLPPTVAQSFLTPLNTIILQRPTLLLTLQQKKKIPEAVACSIQQHLLQLMGTTRSQT